MVPTLNRRLSMASSSIGLSKHTFHQKIEALSQAGFYGIELAFPDLLAFAQSHANREIASNDYDALCEAGQQLGDLVRHHNLKIMVLKSFRNFEGWPERSKEREEAFARARGWIRIMDAVGTDMLLVGSSDAGGIVSSIEQLASDLAQLADMLHEKGFKLAYGNLCWATHASTWKEAWNLILQADRPNIGLCLNTFQTAGGEWGDPRTGSGQIEMSGISSQTIDTRYNKSLQELSREVPADKIYFVQISDAYRISPPMKNDFDESGLPSRAGWSRSYRPLPYDGGYLPIAQVVEAVLETGFRGWFSIEVFDGRFEKKYGDNLTKFAKKGINASEKLLLEASEREENIDAVK